jgi:hypothetical protein
MIDHLTLLYYLFHSKAWFIRSGSNDLSTNLMLTLIPGVIKQVRQGAKVIIETPYPELFENNSNVDFVTSRHLVTSDRFITPRFQIDTKSTESFSRQVLDTVALRTSPFWDMNARNHRENLGKWRKKRLREEELLERLRESFDRPVMNMTQRELDDAAREFQKEFIAIDPAAGGPWGTDRLRWPKEHFQKVRNAFPDSKFVQIGNENAPLLDKVVDARGVSPRKTAAILSNARFLIASPGLSMHLNKAVGKRAAIIMGGAIREGIADYDDDLAFFHPQSCSPCYVMNARQAPCPNNRTCLTEIDPGLVIGNIRDHYDELTD